MTWEGPVPRAQVGTTLGASLHDMRPPAAAAAPRQIASAALPHALRLHTKNIKTPIQPCMLPLMQTSHHYKPSPFGLLFSSFCVALV